MSEAINKKSGVKVRFIKIAIPEDFLKQNLTIGERAQKLHREVVLDMLRNGRIGIGRAAQLLEVTKDEMFDIAAKEKTPWVHLSIEDVEKDTAALRKTLKSEEE